MGRQACAPETLPHLAQGTRFAILHGDGPKPALTVYNMKDVAAAVKGVQPAGTLPGRTANSIHWSPQGKNLVLAGLKVRPPTSHEASALAALAPPPFHLKSPGTPVPMG